MAQLAGEDILASDIKVPRFIQKAAAEIVNNSAVLQNDNDFAPVLPVGVWRVELFCHITAANATPDFQAAWTFSGTASGVGRSCIGPEAASVSAIATLMRHSTHAIGTAFQVGIGTATTTLYHEDMMLTVSVAGTLQFQWAQFVANASDTTLSTASRMYITELEAY